MPPTYSVRIDPERDSAQELATYDALTQRLLCARDITTQEDAQVFFSRDYKSGLHDPFLLNDMDRAVARILEAIDAGERIAIYSDYDCDGIPGGVLMHDFFSAIGYANFENYIPHRHTEGYGLNSDAIDALHVRGATLMITVDCGITDHDEVAHAHALGIDVIVTDHHEPEATLPPAYAVLNPKRADSTYPFSGLCGTGVAFKLVSALLQKLSERPSFSWREGKEKWFLDVVGLATIADMVPLRDENRILAHYGLMVMRKNRRTGLAHLLRAMRMDPRMITEDDIGFMIGPRINAASRMGAPHDAFRLLATTDEGEAGALARHLEELNNERKGVVASMVKSVKHKLSLRESIDPVLVVGDPAWRPSLVGLAATSLVEEYARPVFVWGRDGRETVKGSCRSNGRVSVVELMRGAHDVFIEYGGHHASGGFAVHETHIHTFAARLNEAYSSLMMEANPTRSTHYVVDAELTLHDVTPQFARMLARFGPFGIENEKPLFVFPRVTPTRVDIFGKQKAHTKLHFDNGRGTLAAIGFFKTPDQFAVTPEVGKAIDLLAYVEESTYQGKTELRLRIVDIAVSV